MQETSALYKQIIAQTNHWFEVSLVIGESGRLLDDIGNILTFGGTAILIAQGGGDSGFREAQLKGITTSNSLFSEDKPSVGNAISGEIEISMYQPLAEIPRMATLKPYVRATDGTNTSEWVQKGVYYIDTRDVTKDGSGLNVLTLHGFDDMLKADQDYGKTDLVWPAADIDVVAEIAAKMGVSVDPRTWQIMNKGYRIEYPSNYTCREVLSYIAASYAGSFIMSEIGQLRLVALWELPRETNLLIDNSGYVITFGGDRILV